MSLMRVAIIAIALVTASVAVGLTALASCIQQTVAEQAGRADAIVYARVHGFAGPPAGAPPSRIALIRVERVLKGQVFADIGVALGPSAEGGGPVATSIDYAVRQGEDHTLYLRREGGRWATDACSGSHLGPPTGDEAAILGPGQAPDRTPVGTGVDSGTDAVVAAIATLVALAAGIGAIVYAQRSAGRRAVG